MLSHLNIHTLVFIDIETVPVFGSWKELSPIMQELWATKHATLKIEGETAEDGYLKRSGVYAEFAKIICISLGYFYFDKTENKRIFRVKSTAGDDEKTLLLDFLKIVEKSFYDPEVFRFCGHNIREFDIPFICRRLLINQIDLPGIFDNSGKRPWEMADVDTLQLWKFGDYKSYSSLKLLAEVLGIPTPKDDMEGKDVCRVYWQEGGLDRIVEYCQKDVITVARLLLRFTGDKQLLNDGDVVVVK